MMTPFAWYALAWIVVGLFVRYAVAVWRDDYAGSDPIARPMPFGLSIALVLLGAPLLAVCLAAPVLFKLLDWIDDLYQLVARAIRRRAGR